MEQMTFQSKINVLEERLREAKLTHEDQAYEAALGNTKAAQNLKAHKDEVERIEASIADLEAGHRRALAKQKEVSLNEWRLKNERALSGFKKALVARESAAGEIADLFRQIGDKVKGFNEARNEAHSAALQIDPRPDVEAVAHFSQTLSASSTIAYGIGLLLAGAGIREVSDPTAIRGPANYDFVRDVNSRHMAASRILEQHYDRVMGGANE
jgi:hypothetical protein